MTRMWGRLALSWLPLALGLPAAAAEPLSGDRLRAEVTGNTLTGFNSSGVVFSEFHAPDGRILGHNNSEVVVDGCWQVRHDASATTMPAARAPEPSAGASSGRGRRGTASPASRARSRGSRGWRPATRADIPTAALPGP